VSKEILVREEQKGAEVDIESSVGNNHPIKNAPPHGTQEQKEGVRLEMADAPAKDGDCLC